MLVFDDVTLRRGTAVVLERVSFIVNPGEKIAVVGANGAGKSSLLGLVLGELHVDTGEVSLPSKLNVASVAQETVASDSSAIDHVLDGDRRLRDIEAALRHTEQLDEGLKHASLLGDYEAAGGYDANARAARLLHGLGFAKEQMGLPVDSFSGGWRMRLNLAQALMSPSDVLLLDEPTNHLDLDAILWLEDWLKVYPGTLLLVSHDRDFIDTVATRIAHVDRRQVKLYRGNYSQFERQRAEALSLQQAMFDKQQRERAHMQRFVDRFRYKASKARQAQSRLKALERLEDIAPAHADSKIDFALPAPERMPRSLLALDGTGVGYGERVVLSNLKMRLHPGDRIGLLGLNGAGKSTLIKLLNGSLAPMAGDVERANGLKVGYFAQHQLEQLDMGLSPLETFTAATREENVRPQRLRDFLGSFGFSGERAERPVRTLSGGEKARLTLALTAWRAPHILLLDEPTNHLDLDMRHALTIALQEYEGAVVLVSHDRHLLRLVADDLLLVDRGLVRPYDGDLDDYASWLRQARKALADDSALTDGAIMGGATPAGASAPPTREDKTAKRKSAADARAQLKPLRKQVKDMERLMERLRSAKREIDERLADPALYESADGEELSALTRDSGRYGAELDQAETAWMEACEKLEAGEASL